MTKTNNWGFWIAGDMQFHLKASHSIPHQQNPNVGRFSRGINHLCAEFKLENINAQVFEIHIHEGTPAHCI